ncbi:MAG: hypothetical protein CML02_20000 [Pseudooceanicola sp.]|nr:hypothetical protein [Pseudooceanicola sp.]
MIAPGPGALRPALKFQLQPSQPAGSFKTKLTITQGSEVAGPPVNRVVLIPEDLYIQVGARYLDQDPDRASSLGFA